MPMIIAGMFDTFEQGERACESLRDAGFDPFNTSVFFNNPPGRHDRTPIGGDENADPHAAHMHVGAATGAAVGAGIGLAALAAGPLAAAAAAGVGAYAGALAGGVSKASDAHTPPARRPAGVMVAVNIGDGAREDDAVFVLQQSGARNIERAFGTWRDGEWIDFDPVEPPHLIGAEPALATGEVD